MKRIGVMQILQESNSFNPIHTTLADFERFGVGLGKEVIKTFGEVDEIGGFLEGLRSWDEAVEPVGLIRAQAWPCGPLSRETMKWFINAIRQQLSQAAPLDGLLIALHGAMVGDGESDLEGFFLEESRRVLGPNIPIVATLDLHAHLTFKMKRFADILVAYHTSPHLDRHQTGMRAAKILRRILSGANPVTKSISLPMITTGEPQNTSGEVLSPIFEKLREWEERADVLSAAVLMTQAWLDVPGLGWSTMMVTDGKPELAQKLANELAEMCWNQRKNLVVKFYSGEESVSRALACPGKPVIIADGPDSTNSGGGGDSIHLLQIMIHHKIPDGGLTIMVDPAAVAHARKIGEGGAFQFAVGGKRDCLFSQPLNVMGRVLSIQPARYVLSGHAGDRLPIDMGVSATIQIGDVTLLLVEYTGPGSTPMMYRCVGLEPKNFKIVVVKSPMGFRAEFEPFAADIILSDCPGIVSPHFSSLPYKRIDRPLWPLDDIDDWRDVEWRKGINENPRN